MKDLVNIVGLSRASIYRLMDSGDFPEAIDLTGSRSVAWREDEIQAWIDSRPRTTGINRGNQ